MNIKFYKFKKIKTRKLDKLKFDLKKYSILKLK